MSSPPQTVAKKKGRPSSQQSPSRPMYKNLHGNWFYCEFDRTVCTLKLPFSKCAYLLQRYRCLCNVFVSRCLCLTNSYPINAILASRCVFSPSKTAKTLDLGGGEEARGGIACIKHWLSVIQYLHPGKPYVWPRRGLLNLPHPPTFLAGFKRSAR